MNELLSARFLPAQITEKDGKKILLCDESRAENEYEDCGFRVPLHLRENPNPPTPPAPKRGKYPKIFKTLFDYDKEFEVPSAILKWQLRKWLDNETWFHVQLGEITKCFPANRKGSERYSLEKALKLKDFAEIAQKSYKNAYFITLTQNPKWWFSSFSEEWKNAQKAANRFCKELQRRIGGAYICVREATAAGHVHFHIVFFTDEEWNKKGVDLIRAHGQMVIRKGGIKDFVLRLWDSWRGFSEVQPIQGGQAAAYAVKYVGKNANENLRKLADKKHFSKKDRKAAQSFLFPLAFGLRTFSASSERKLLAHARDVLGDDEFFDAEAAASRNALSRKITSEIFAEREESLKTLSQIQYGDWRECGAEKPRSGLLDLACINFPKKCRRNLRLLNVRDVPKEILENPGVTPLGLRGKSEEMRQKARPVGCGGCAWSHIWLEILGYPSEWFRLLPFRRSKEEIAAIVDLTCDSRFRPFGYDVFRVDVRVLAALFPWWRYAQTLAHRAAVRRLRRPIRSLGRRIQSSEDDWLAQTVERNWEEE